MQLSPVKKTLLVSLPLGMLLGIAGTVLAADPRLDDANAHCDQAVALLTAAANPGETPEFGGHRKRAIDDIQRAQKEIKAAKEFADRSKDGGAPAPSGSAPKPKPKPAPSGGHPHPAPSGGYKK